MSNLIVSGASGNLSRLVIESLVQAKTSHHIIGLTRAPQKSAYLEDLGVELRSASFDDSVEKIAESLGGAEKLLIISTDNFKRRLDQHKRAIDSAKLAGLKQVLYTSIQNADTSKAIGADSHHETEKYLMDSGLDYTILRNNLYMNNLVPKLAGAAQFGGFMGCSGAGKFAYIAREDCGKAAACAMLDDRSANRILNITGPKAYSYIELAQVLGDLLERNITYENLDYESFLGNLISWGLRRDAAEAIASFDLAALNNDLGYVSNDFEVLTGHGPTTLEDFLVPYRELLLEQR